MPSTEKNNVKMAHKTETTATLPQHVTKTSLCPPLSLRPTLIYISRILSCECISSMLEATPSSELKHEHQLRHHSERQRQHQQSLEGPVRPCWTDCNADCMPAHHTYLCQCQQLLMGSSLHTQHDSSSCHASSCMVSRTLANVQF